MTARINKNNLDRLRPGLKPIADRNVFCNYTTHPRAGQPGKLDKVPVVWPGGKPARLTGSYGDPALPAKLLPLDKAIKMVTASAALHGVGLVFTEGCGCTGIDFDNCIDPSTGQANLTSEQREVLKIIKGYAFMERSVSGAGLHAFILGDCVNAKAAGQIEVFGTSGFIALTGAGGTGVMRPAPREVIEGVLSVVAKLKGNRHPIAKAYDGAEVNDEVLRATYPKMTVAQVRDMLTYIPAATGDGCDYEMWRNVIWGVRDGLGDEGYGVALEWSNTSPIDFDQQAFDRVWSSDRAQGGRA